MVSFRTMSSSRPPIYPPVYFIVALLVQFALHETVPIARILGSPARYVGVAVASIGMAALLVTARTFDRRGTAIKPFKESSSLITDGLYRFSRNPIYLSMIVMLAGAALFLGTVSPYIVVAVFPGVIARRFIRHEEAMLESRFKEEFLQYKSRVRRWL